MSDLHIDPAVVAYANETPYRLHIYWRVTEDSDRQRYIGFYEVAGVSAVLVGGETEEEVKAKAAKHHLHACASILKQIGGVEAAKLRRAEARTRRLKKKEAV